MLLIVVIIVTLWVLGGWLLFTYWPQESSHKGSKPSLKVTSKSNRTTLSELAAQQSKYLRSLKLKNIPGSLWADIINLFKADDENFEVKQSSEEIAEFSEKEIPKINKCSLYSQETPISNNNACCTTSENSSNVEISNPFTVNDKRESDIDISETTVEDMLQIISDIKEPLLEVDLAHINLKKENIKDIVDTENVIDMNKEKDKTNTNLCEDTKIMQLNDRFEVEDVKDNINIIEDESQHIEAISVECFEHDNEVIEINPEMKNTFVKENHMELMKDGDELSIILEGEEITEHEDVDLLEPQDESDSIQNENDDQEDEDDEDEEDTDTSELEEIVMSVRSDCNKSNSFGSVCSSLSEKFMNSEEAKRLKFIMEHNKYLSECQDLDEYAEEILKLYFSSSVFADNSALEESDCGESEDEQSLGALSLSKLLEPSHSGIIDFGTKTEANVPWFDSTPDVSETNYSLLHNSSCNVKAPFEVLESELDSPPEVVVRKRQIAQKAENDDQEITPVYVIRTSDTSSLGSSDDSGIGTEYMERLLLQSQPTIFGTVADDHTPRDNTTKRGLPQTPKSGAKSYPYNGVDRSAHSPEWATTPDDDNSLVYEDGVLISGSLQALVQHAVPTAVYYPDTAYLFAFLLSSRLFIKPHELLQKICNVGFTQQGLKGNDLSTINKEKLGRFIPHMVQLLGEWSETFPYDFRDERMMGGVRTMTHRCIALEPSLRRDVTQVLHNLLNKLTQLERYEEGLAKLFAPPPSDFITQPSDITEVCESPLVMAQQLTHIELEKLSYIGPEEFVQAFAKDNLDACYKDLKKTSNLESYIQWFNRLSYLVATHACTHVKKKQRVRVIEWWIEVARECFNIGNFNSLMGIIAGLNMSIVSRLKKTWSKIQSAKFSVLEHQMDPSSNFSSYRSTLKAAMWRSAGAIDDRQKIVIPFFSLLVKDLYFLNEGCASRLPNGHINFDKFWQLAKQVTEFMAWKQVTCPFEKVNEVINYMQTTQCLTETGLALASFECEGPENSYEKERCKTLKADTQQHLPS